MDWGTFRTQIRRSVLADDDALNWTDAALLDFYGWAQERLIDHTALVKTTQFDSTTEKSASVFYDMAVDTEFTLPSDIYESLDIGGMVYRAINGEKTYYDPLWRTISLSPYADNPNTFEIVGDSLVLSEPPGVGSTLHLRYFAYYPIPVLDTDVLTIPQWSWGPIALFVGYYALTAPSISSANIDRWKDRTDSGNPEQNALAQQQRHMLQQAEQALSVHSRQDRANHFRTYNG